MWGQWVSAWRLLVRGPPLLAVLPLSAREGHRDSLSGFFCSVGGPLCHLSPQVSSGSAPPTLSTHLSMPLRGPGSTQAQSLCFGPHSLLSSGGHSVPLVLAAPLGAGGAPLLCPPWGMGPKGKTWLQVETSAPSRPVCTLPCRPDPTIPCGGSLSHMWGS